MKSLLSYCAKVALLGFLAGLAGSLALVLIWGLGQL